MGSVIGKRPASMYSPREKVFWFSVLSRAFVILLQFLFNLAIPDHEADAFRSPGDPSEPLDESLVDFLLGGLTRWDGQYFLHISRYGYTHENTLAFFPAYPLCVRYLAAILRTIAPSLGSHGATVLAAVSVSYYCFVKSALVLYDLGVRALADDDWAYKAAILYCVNPASVFFSAAYSESMFAYVTFSAMLRSLVEPGLAWLPVGLSCLVRSNGLVNLGFPVFAYLREGLAPVASRESSLAAAVSLRLCRVLRRLPSILNTVFLALVPFAFLQIWIYLVFCTEYGSENSIAPHVVSWAKRNRLATPGDPELTWCEANLPIAYTVVQKKYWNVGFMRYYVLKQIPNFLLASPMLFLVLKCVARYFLTHGRNIFRYLSIGREGDREKFVVEKDLPIGILVFVVHALCLTLFTIFFVHIQVGTRLLASASPLLYWYCAGAMSHGKGMVGKERARFEDPNNLCSKWRVFFFTQKTYTTTDTLILSYFLGYLIAGCFMFSNFLPWT